MLGTPNFDPNMLFFNIVSMKNVKRRKMRQKNAKMFFALASKCWLKVLLPEMFSDSKRLFNILQIPTRMICVSYNSYGSAMVSLNRIQEFIDAKENIIKKVICLS